MILSYEQAQEYCVKNNITTFRSFLQTRNKTKGILPGSPARYYKKEGKWKSWNDFTKTKKWSYKKTKRYIQNLNLKSQKDFKNTELPKQIPKNPESHYKEWQNWYAFLNKPRSKKLSYNDAKKLINKLQIKNVRDYLIKRTEQLPANPPQHYKKEWKNWGDFLQNNNTKNFLTYEEAKKLVKKLGIKSSNEYYKLARQNKLPLELPRSPEGYYSNYWRQYNYKRRKKNV